MSLDNADPGRVPKRATTDLLYGLDTGAQKYRTLFRRRYYPGESDDQHKIDFYTRGFGTDQGEERWPGQKDIPKKPGDALPKTWRDARQGDTPERIEYRKFIEITRYNPELAKEGLQWNARFRRTSKAGLQWGLLAKKWFVHFVTNDIDFHEVIGKSTLGAWPHRLPLAKGSPAGNEGSRRITHCELRWLYRHRKFKIVHANVQFWYFDKSVPDDNDRFKPIVAPWISDPKLWEQYKSKEKHHLDDYSLAKQYAPDEEDVVYK
jgi:hypothetical protein